MRVEDLVATIERKWRNVVAHKDKTVFVAHLMRFFAWMDEDERTRWSIQDLEHEEAESCERFRLAEQSTREAVMALLSSFDACEGKSPEDENGLAYVRRYLNGELLVADVTTSVTRSVLSIAERIRERVYQQLLRTQGEPSEALNRQAVVARDLYERSEAIAAKFQHSQRERALDRMASASAALSSLRQAFSALHPPPTQLPPGWDNHDPYRHLRNEYFRRDIAMLNEPKAIAEGVMLLGPAANVVDDVLRRIDRQRSLRSLFKRYQQRVEWYDANELRKLALESAGKVEDALALTLAKYLFDNGLNPLTQPMIGQARPDLLAGGRFSFYVEAKQYIAGNRPYMLRAFNQIWDMFDRVRDSEYDVREAFLVVFRRGGPRYQFPDSIVNDRRTVHTLVVDIAPMSESGSKAPSTEKFEGSELLPGAVKEALSALGDQPDLA